MGPARGQVEGHPVTGKSITTATTSAKVRYGAITLDGAEGNELATALEAARAAASTGVSTTDVLATLIDEPQRIDLVPRCGSVGPNAGSRCPAAAETAFRDNDDL